MALEALGEGEVGVKTSKDAGRPGAGGGATTWRSFSLDKALGPTTTQEEVFRQVNWRSFAGRGREEGRGGGRGREGKGRNGRGGC